MLSFWLDEFLDSFLGKKNKPASFLLVFAEKLGRVYEALGLTIVLSWQLKDECVGKYSSYSTQQMAPCHLRDGVET